MIKKVFTILLLLALFSSVLSGTTRKERKIRRHTKKSKKIINGKTAVPHSHPYMITFLNSKGNFFCGGVIIEENFILTAAHCLVSSSFSPTLSRAVAGVHNLTDFRETGQKRIIEEFVNHPNYSKATHANDIGLAYVKKPFRFNKFVGKIELSRDDTVPIGDVYIAGWGYTKKDDRSSVAEVLQETSLFVESNSSCIRNQGSAGQPPDNICFWDLSKDQSAPCRGDSGSPVYKLNGDLRELVSLDSYGSCHHRKVDSGPWIPRYLDWIEKTKEGILLRQEYDYYE